MKTTLTPPPPASTIVLRIPCTPEARAWYIWASRHGIHYGKPFHEFCRTAMETALRQSAADRIKRGGKIPQPLAEYLAQSSVNNS